MFKSYEEESSYLSTHLILHLSPTPIIFLLQESPFIFESYLLLLVPMFLKYSCYLDKDSNELTRDMVINADISHYTYVCILLSKTLSSCHIHWETNPSLNQRDEYKETQCDRHITAIMPK